MAYVCSDRLPILRKTLYAAVPGLAGGSDVLFWLAS
jgi:hypothetical protein